MDKLSDYVQRVASGVLTGQDLAALVESGELDKSQRRSIQKQAAKLCSGKLTAASASITATAKVAERGDLKGSAELAAATGKKRRAAADEDEDDDVEEGQNDTGDEMEEERTSAQFTPKQLKMKLKLLNKELATFALKKQLVEAKKRLQAGIRKGMKPDVHTFSNLINCYVRCGDVAGARRVLSHDMPGAGVAPNAVTLTTLLKGCCEAGDMAAARRILFEDMPRLQTAPVARSSSSSSSSSIGSGSGSGSGSIPNGRAVLTYLRGCARTGAVLPAHDLLRMFGAAGAGAGAPESESESFGTSARAHVVSLLCQSLQSGHAVRTAAMLPATSTAPAAASGPMDADVTALDCVGAYLSLAQMHALLGRLVEASQWARKARSSLDADKSNSLLQAMRRHSSTAAARDAVSTVQYSTVQCSAVQCIFGVALCCFVDLRVQCNAMCCVAVECLECSCSSSALCL